MRGYILLFVVAQSQIQKAVIKAEGAEHSGPIFKPDNAENGLLGRAPLGLGPFQGATVLLATYLGPPNFMARALLRTEIATSGAHA